MSLCNGKDSQEPTKYAFTNLYRDKGLKTAKRESRCRGVRDVQCRPRGLVLLHRTHSVSGSHNPSP